LGRPPWPPRCPRRRPSHLPEPLDSFAASSSLRSSKPRSKPWPGALFPADFGNLAAARRRAPPVSGRAPLGAARGPPWPFDRGSMVFFQSWNYPFGRSTVDPWTPCAARLRPSAAGCRSWATVAIRSGINGLDSIRELPRRWVHRGPTDQVHRRSTAAPAVHCETDGPDPPGP
jgi:hypothetical protein